MKPVIQLELTGCGIASVAAIVGVSYSRAKSVASSLGISADDRALWSETAHVRKLLRHYGLRAGLTEIPFRTWDALPNLALLSIKWHLEEGRPFWHWVVFARESGRSYVLDSKRSLQRHTRTGSRRLSSARALLRNVNTAALEYAPAVSSDLLELFFTRLERSGRSPRTAILRSVRPSAAAPFGPPERLASITGFVEAPTLSSDGRSLYYHQLDAGRFVILRVAR